MHLLSADTAAHCKSLGMTDEMLEAIELIDPESRQDILAKQSWIPMKLIDSDELDISDTKENVSDTESVGTLLAVELDLDEAADLSVDPHTTTISHQKGPNEVPQHPRYKKLKGLDWNDLPDRMPDWIMIAFMKKDWRLIINRENEVEIEVSGGRNDLIAWLTDILTKGACHKEALRAPIGGDGKEAVAHEASRLMGAHHKTTRKRDTIHPAGAGLVDQMEE